MHVTATDPESGEVVQLFNPRVDDWSAHFGWTAPDSSVLEAVTKQGRATLAVLDLNAPRALAIRRWLAAVGMHPPT